MREERVGRPTTVPDWIGPDQVEMVSPKNLIMKLPEVDVETYWRDVQTYLKDVQLIIFYALIEEIIEKKSQILADDSSYPLHADA